jgi:hypothetical protein
VDILGGVRATGRALDISHVSIVHYLNGKHPVPPGTAVELRMLAMKVPLFKEEPADMAAPF